jgi:hypothetical protein
MLFSSKPGIISSRPLIRPKVRIHFGKEIGQTSLREVVAGLIFGTAELLSIRGNGLVSRVESAEDRRVRIVALTPRGKDLIVSAFQKHSGQMKRVFSQLSVEELRALEAALKK